jgi:hypothetical protein
MWGTQGLFAEKESRDAFLHAFVAQRWDWVPVAQAVTRNAFARAQGLVTIAATAVCAR